MACLSVVCGPACAIERGPAPARLGAIERPRQGDAAVSPDAGEGLATEPERDAGIDAGLSAEDAAVGASDAGDAVGGEPDAAGAGGEPDAADAGGVDGGIGAPDAGSPPRDTFGLTCAGQICRSVRAPAAQCCTAARDVAGRRAGAAGRCGVDLEDGMGCRELEQLGALDDACPSAPALSGGPVEQPGCCTTAGRCGTFDAERQLGCHENPEVDRACGAEPPPDASGCDPTGVYAVRADVDVVFGAQTTAIFEVLDAGRGDIQIVFEARLAEVAPDGGFVARFAVCGIGLPPIKSSLLCERYRPGFDDALFDGAGLEAFPVTGRYACQKPGCVVTFDATTRAFGISLPNPEAPWPIGGQTERFTCAAGEGSPACFPDADRDGEPGITMRFANQGMGAPDGPCRSGYRTTGAPLSANPLVILDGVVRTDRVGIAVRTRLGAVGLLGDDCAISDATGLADFIDSRAVACLYQPGSRNLFSQPAGDNDPCASGELAFMDENMPVYEVLGVGEQPDPSLGIADMRPSDGPRFRVARVGDASDASTCAQIRTAVGAD